MTRARSEWTPPWVDTDLPTAPMSRAAVIQASHQRSAALGLSRGERLAFGPMMRSDLTVARERNQRLCVHAAPVMQVLFEQIAGSDSMIVLTDAHGTILYSVGDDDFLARADKVALAPGENWAEHAKGTNAIGTALFEEKPTLVHAHEHFIHANSFLTCSAAPIFDPRGHVLGVLDVTGDHRGYHQHTMGLVRMSARMIENHWLGDDCNHHLRLHFHSRPEFIGTLLEGIVAVAPDGKIVGGNRSAMDQLGLSGNALRAQSLASLFGTSTAALHDHFRTPLATPMRLNGPTGLPFCVSARLNGPSQPLAVGTGLASLAEPAAAPLLASPAGTSAATPACAPVGATFPVLPAGPAAAPPGTALQALCTGDAQIEQVVHKLRRVIDRGIPLLILGETGTGKTLVARAVHQDSTRARQPFVAVDCASMPASLIETELFGCEEGVRTGVRRKAAPVRIAQAQGGTLFLEAVDELPLALQGRLLRVLQSCSLTPPNSDQAMALDVAVISASHRDLREMIKRHEFREDLYQHLSGLALRLPALRERSDLVELAQRIVLAHRPADPPAISPPVLDLFRRCDWSGNVRQLTKVLRTACALSAGERSITTAHLSDDFLEAAHSPEPRASGSACTLEAAETALIRNTLQALGGNISAASKQLGISRNTIYRKLRWKADR